MIHLFTALTCEAAPFIKHYRLKQDLRLTKFRVYQGNDITLVVTGVGKLRAAMAVVYSLCRLTDEDLRATTAVNLGLCGTVSRQFSTGELVAVHKIVDHSRSRSFFPDMLLKHGLREAGLETFDQPVQKPSSSAEALVDMEAAGFCEAAALYLSPDRLFCLKIVSDYVGDEFVSAKDATMMIEQRLLEIHNILDNWRKYHLPPSALFTVNDQQWLNAIIAHYHCTQAQQLQLRKATRHYVLREKCPLPDLTLVLNNPAQHPYERRQAFNSLLTKLNSENPGNEL